MLWLVEAQETDPITTFLVSHSQMKIYGVRWGTLYSYFVGNIGWDIYFAEMQCKMDRCNMIPQQE